MAVGARTGIGKYAQPPIKGRRLCNPTILVWGLAIISAGGWTRAAELPVTCETCHPQESAQFRRSVHSRAGFDCRKCHGGPEAYNLQPAQLTVYTQKATPQNDTRPPFDHGKAFTGKPRRSQVPQRCAECHSDVEMMNPYGLRTDQLDRYKTSVHGRTLYVKNDDRVAVCIDCHGTHEILVAKDPASSVNPQRIPDTCGRCHGDSSLMVKYRLSSVVISDYKRSLHGQALVTGDLAMPTCPTCHGNHGARPPGYRNVGHVCGRCHKQTEGYFEESVHAKFPNFPPCLGCHAPDPATRPHLILPVSRTPEELVKTYLPRWQKLTARGESEEKIDETLGREMRQARDKLAVQLRNVCRQCHGKAPERGHGTFFAELDWEAIARGVWLEEKIEQAERQFVKTTGRVDRVGRGVLLVESETFALEQARTELVTLAAVQHTLDKARVAETAENVLSICGKIESDLDEKVGGLQWRYRALAPMWAFLMVFISALWIKYKRLKQMYVVSAGETEGAGNET